MSESFARNLLIKCFHKHFKMLLDSCIGSRGHCRSEKKKQLEKWLWLTTVAGGGAIVQRLEAMSHLSEKVQPSGNSVSSGTVPGMVVSRVCRNELWS